MKLRQTQVMLILENAGLSIHSKPGVYEDVMNAWMLALVTMNDTVGGVAQNVCGGGVLLALSAWHLYPDMVFLGREMTHIRQNDSILAPGGLITIGISHSEKLDGISWSMSLAHMRYYGRPVESQRSVGATSTKVPFEMIVYVAIGSMLNAWGDVALNIPNTFKVWVILQNHLLESISRRRLLAWFHLLADYANSFLDASAFRQEELTRFIQLGRRRCKTFLSERDLVPKQATPFWGLLKTSSVHGLVGLLDAQERSPPRQFASPDSSLSGDTIPRVSDTDSPSEEASATDSIMSLIADPTSDNLSLDALLVILDSIPIDASKLEAYLVDQGYRDGDDLFESLDVLYLASEIYRDLPGAEVSLSVAGKPLLFTSFGIWAADFRRDMREAWLPLRVKRSRRLSYRFKGEHNRNKIVWICVDISPEKNVLSKCKACVYKKEYNAYHNAVAHLRRDHFNTKSRPKYPYILAGGWPPMDELKKWTLQVETEHSKKVEEPNTHFNKRNLRKSQISNALRLACIALFDTGNVELSVQDLENVFAISTGSSLYILESLFCDPYTISLCPSGRRVRHLIGNIGKPGVCLLVSTPDALVREADLENWRLVNHNPFDGQLQDSFRGTSLYLHLTGYEQSIVDREHSGRDKMVKYFQVVISTYDQGEWVADIDLRMLMAPQANLGTLDPWLTLANSCSHSEKDQGDFKRLPPLVTVDNWHEFLDPPITTSVIRARGNWLARLALAAVAKQQGMSLIVASENICWACAGAQLRQMET